jgi:CBS domain-containing protein
MNMLVEELMTRKPASVRPNQTLSVAARLMWDRDCGALPVLDDNDEVRGMITDRDVCMATWSRGHAPNMIFVAEAMSRNPVVCRPQDTIARAELMMQTEQVRRLPVVDSERRLIGILSLADIARATEIAPAFGLDRDLSSQDLTTTLAGICTVPPPAIAIARSRPGATI